MQYRPVNIKGILVFNSRLTVAVAQRKGGVGKTTLAISLAGEWRHRGRDVLLIDSDPQRSCCAWAAPGRLTFPVQALELDDGAIGTWASAIRAIKASFKVIDTSPNEHAVAAAIAVADLIVIPCTPSGLDLDSTEQTLAIIRAVRQRRTQQLRALLVPNRVDLRSLEGRQLMDELAQFGEPVANPVVNRTIFARAFSCGETVNNLPGARSAAREIAMLCDLADSILAADPPR